MNSIADSSSVYNEERMLAQHQAALTIVQGLISNPRLEEFVWLDLACGRGQIIAHLERNLSDAARKKVRYFGYDISNDAIRRAEGKADTLALRERRFVVGELANFPKNVDADLRFDFITLTNTVHEIAPRSLAQTIYEAVRRLSQDGVLFVYDMETLPAPDFELGAIPWKKAEVAEVVTSFLHAAGVVNYEPGYGQWAHTRVNGWNVQLVRSYMRVTDDELNVREDTIVSATADTIRRILQQKFELCKSSLDSLTRLGVENKEEAADKQRLLYDFWALFRALEDA